MRAPKERTGDLLLSSGAAAELLFVDPRTVTRWAAAGKLEAIRTAGGHRRYRRSDIMTLVAQMRAGTQGDVVPERGSIGRDRGSRQARSAALTTAAVDRARARASEDATTAMRLVAVAASRAAMVAADEAATARRARRVAAEAAAHLVARAAALDAVRTQRQAARAVERVRHAADLAATALSLTTGLTGGEDARRRAATVSAAVDASALAVSRDTARAAQVVAKGVAAAAAGVADTAAVLEQSIEVEVSRGAVARTLVVTMAAQGVARAFTLQSAGLAVAAEQVAAAVGSTSGARSR